MKRTVRSLALFFAFLAVASCGDSSGPDGDRTLLDFEDHPDDGFGAETLPFTLGPGVLLTATNPTGSVHDMSTTDGWGLIGCDASAFSGNILIGVEDGGDIYATITFDAPVSAVEVIAGNADSNVVSLLAFNAAGAVVASDANFSVCPQLTAADRLLVEADDNVITRIELRGSYIAFDDLAYYRK
jgi:hypothetical protein